MELMQAPRGMRTHIALFGKRNAGKSSLINALTGQDTAIVSEHKGTTTDPVYKSIELFPLGPAVLIDTAGLDDTGTLGELRREKSIEVLHRADIALYVVDATAGLTEDDNAMLARIGAKRIPLLLVWNKAELLGSLPPPPDALAVSALTGMGIPALIQALSANAPSEAKPPELLEGIVSSGQLVILVTPIDASAPKGRLILPQQQVLRGLLELGTATMVVQPEQLAHCLSLLSRQPDLVITDSQVFAKVSAELPSSVPLTSFSILFARAKGDLAELVQGAKAISRLQDGDRVLIAEACTHHRQEDDIGRVKIPRLLLQKTGKQLEFDFCAGLSYEKELGRYALIVHCGACMINRTEMLSRIEEARADGVSIVNYGILIACITGILDRVLEPIPQTSLVGGIRHG